MAPEPTILKRKRSRPSDYWVVNFHSTTAVAEEVAEAPAKETKSQPSEKEATKRGIKDAPASGNRGKNLKKSAGRDEENRDAHTQDDLANTKPRRRGRSSVVNTELEAALAGFRNGQGSKGKKNESVASNAKGPRKAAENAPQKKKQSIATQAADELGDTQAQAPEAGTKRRRRAAGQPEGQVTASEPIHQRTAPKRKGHNSLSGAEEAIDVQVRAGHQIRPRGGRRSNTPLEIQAIAKASVVPESQIEPRRNRQTAVARKDAEDVVEESVKHQEGPKKRDRRPSIMIQSNGTLQVPAEGQLRRRKNARMSDPEIINPEPVDELQAEDEEIGKKRKRKAQSADQSSSSDIGRGKKRARKADAEARAKAVDRGPSPKEEHRGRTRTRSNAANKEAPAVDARRKAQGTEDTDPTDQVVSASSRFARDRGQARKNVSSGTSRAKLDKTSATAQESTKSRKSNQLSKKPSQPQARREKEAKVAGEPSNKRSRVEENIQQGQVDADELPDRTPYSHLEAVTSNVSLQVIDENWEPLPQSCIDQISTLLKEIQKPVTARIENDQKWNQASAAVNSVVNRVLRKLSKHRLPFPQATYRSREDDFDYEKVMENNRALQYQMTPAIHANELLRDELRKELARLGSDKQNLAGLEVNAKKEVALRAEAARSMHSLLQVDSAPLDDSLRFDIGLDEKQIRRSLDADIKDNENLKALVKDISGHMDAFQGNFSQVDGIVEALARTKGAVQVRLFDLLDAAQYEAVVLGDDE